MLGAGAIDKLQYWTILEYLNFPMAKQIKAQIETQMQQEAMMQQQQMEIQAQQAQMSAQGNQTPQMSFDNHFMNLSPEQQEMFNSLPQAAPLPWRPRVAAPPLGGPRVSTRAAARRGAPGATGS